jgi:hypothetical protein
MKHLPLALLLPLFGCSGSPAPASGPASAPTGSSASVALLRLDRVP